MSNIVVRKNDFVIGDIVTQPSTGKVCVVMSLPISGSFTHSLSSMYLFKPVHDDTSPMFYCDKDFAETNFVIQQAKYRYAKYQTLLHVKSGNRYAIVGTPDEYRIEATGEVAYGYRAYIQNDDGEIIEGKTVWIRSRTEMEDGRFVIPDHNNWNTRNELH